MKAVAALVAIAALILTVPALASPAPAAAAGGPLALELGRLEPRVVTADGPDVMTLAGTLRNTGQSPVDGMQIRVQRGDPLGTEGEVRDALGGAGRTDAVAPRFVELPGVLAPGDGMPVQITVPLRGSPETGGLALSGTGVYELLVNVNGVPDGQARARLAAVRMLLPVVSLPPEPGAVNPVRETPAAATPLTVLYPIAADPRRLPTVPGEPPLLTDDDLAASLAPEGRLGGLVAALSRRAPVGSPARAAVCVAVDPDLVATAAAMRGGYQVLGPDGVPVPGTGADAAGRWLDALVAGTRGGCLLALPYADADLVALTRGGLTDLARSAVVDGRTILADELATPVLPGVTWPAGGLLDDATLAGVIGEEGQGLVLSADGVEQGSERRTSGVVPVTTGQVTRPAVLTDPLLSLAAAGPDRPGDPDLRDTGTVTPAGDAVPLSTQDLIGALAFRAGGGAGSGPLVLAPPHQWAVDGSGSDALLTAVDSLVAEGLVTPRGLDRLTADGAPAGADATRLVYPLQAGGREVSPAVIGDVTSIGAEIADLRSAADEQARLGVGPAEFFGPLRLGIVRGASAAWRGRSDAAAAVTETIGERVAVLRATVRVLEPPSPYALGSSDAPLLVTVSNGLPVAMRIRLELASTGGLRVAPIPMVTVPPLGRRQIEVSAETTRAGQFTVRAAVRTPAGGLLGSPSRLQVRSTAYGTVTVWLTATAGLLLVVLTARRVLRRVRGEQPGRDDADHDARRGTDAPTEPIHDRGSRIGAGDRVDRSEPQRRHPRTPTRWP